VGGLLDPVRRRRGRWRRGMEQGEAQYWAVGADEPPKNEKSVLTVTY
jgi:hypothetical protein